LLVPPPASRISPELVSRLYEQSGAGRWELTVDEFRATLDESVERAFSGKSVSPADIERSVAALHVTDLALARACALGHEPAWNAFVKTYRSGLYAAADAIDPTGGTRELADAIYGELFGLRERDGVRQSLLRYFHGRSTLATWLRAVLSQRRVDLLRARRRLEPLPDDDSAPADAAVRRGPADAPDPERVRFVNAMRRALGTAIGGLEPRDRLRLACYYTQEMTLAAIGQMLGEHEATVSRHLTRIRRVLREDVERCLRADHGLDDRAVGECFRAVLDDAGTLDLTELLERAPAAPLPPQGSRPGSFKIKKETGG